eukprot:Opistho-1_new@43062
MNVVKEIERINAIEARRGVDGTNASWHSQYKGSAYVFVGGLPFDLSEGDIIAVFSQYGEIVDVNLVRDKATGKSRGFAFVAYEDQRSTILAVDNFNGIKLLGRTLRVDHVANYKPPKEEEGKDGEPVEPSGRLQIGELYPGEVPESMRPRPAADAEDAAREKKEKKEKKKAKKEKKEKEKKERDADAGVPTVEGPALPPVSSGPAKSVEGRPARENVPTGRGIVEGGGDSGRRTGGRGESDTVDRRDRSGRDFRRERSRSRSRSRSRERARSRERRERSVSAERRSRQRSRTRSGDRRDRGRDAPRDRGGRDGRYSRRSRSRSRSRGRDRSRERERDRR